MLCCAFTTQGVILKRKALLWLLVFFYIKSFALTKSLFSQRTAPEKRPLIGDTSSQGEFTGPAAHDADLKRRLLLS